MRGGQTRRRRYSSVCCPRSTSHCCLYCCNRPRGSCTRCCLTLRVPALRLHWLHDALFGCGRRSARRRLAPGSSNSSTGCTSCATGCSSSRSCPRKLHLGSPGYHRQVALCHNSYSRQSSSHIGHSSSLRFRLSLVCLCMYSLESRLTLR